MFFFFFPPKQQKRSRGAEGAEADRRGGEARLVTRTRRTPARVFRPSARPRFVAFPRLINFCRRRSFRGQHYEIAAPGPRRFANKPQFPQGGRPRERGRRDFLDRVSSEITKFPRARRSTTRARTRERTRRGKRARERDKSTRKRNWYGKLKSVVNGGRTGANFSR